MKTVSEVRAAPVLAAQQIRLDWRNPPAAEFAGDPGLAGIRITRRERMYPAAPDDGTVVYDDSVVASFTDAVPEAQRTYYYTVFAVDATLVARADDRSRAAATSTQNYGLVERLYRMLPAVHQREDRPLTPADLAALDPAVVEALGRLPADLRRAGQLRRYLAAAAAPLDLMRSLAEGLRGLRDVDDVRADLLPALADWLDWRLDRTLPVHAQRNEVKSAPSLYRSVGTAPSLRGLVTRYTGWYAQVAEMGQSLWRSNDPPGGNLFASVQDGPALRGIDEAAPVLGFGAGNDQASGSAALPALLVGTTTAPFALRPGLSLTITADGRIPVTLRFQPGDFATIGAATAAEVAAVMNRAFSELTATPMATGQLELRSHTTGPTSTLRVEQQAASLVSLEGAPRGRLAVFGDPTPLASDRARLVYAEADPLLPVVEAEATRALRGEPLLLGLAPGERRPEPMIQSAVPTTTNIVAAVPNTRLRYKTLRGGTWGSALPLPTRPDLPVGEPAAARLPDGRIFVAWVEEPHTASGRLRFALGQPRTPRPAELVSRRAGPFGVQAGDRLVVDGPWPRRETIEFAAADVSAFPPGSAAQVATAINARSTRIVTTVEPDQTLRLTTVAVGDDAALRIDLDASTAAPALGFEPDNQQAHGDWGDAVDWSPVMDVTTANPGRYADLFATVDGAGNLCLFWARHAAEIWRVELSRWNGTVWSPVEVLASTAGGSREPCAVLDATNRLWLFYARREGVGTAEDSWTLRTRVFSGGAWGVDTAVTTVPAAVPPNDRPLGRDREPSAVLASPTQIRVHFSSNRGGNPALWSVDVATATMAASTPALQIDGPAADSAPCIAALPGRTWLFFRSDRYVSMSQVGVRAIDVAPERVTDLPSAARPTPLSAPRSLRARDTGTVTRFAGAVTPYLYDAQRTAARRRFDDYTTYTSQGVEALTRLGEDDRYTAGTLGLFVSGAVPESVITRQMIDRLLPALDRFLPINTRVVVVLRPPVYVDLVYEPGADIGESFLDDHPFIEIVGDVGETVQLAMPGWSVLRATTLADVSADPTDPASLDRRTFFPPPG